MDEKQILEKIDVLSNKLDFVIKCVEYLQELQIATMQNPCQTVYKFKEEAYLFCPSRP